MRVLDFTRKYPLISIILTSLFTLILSLGVGVALAENNVINACVNKQTGSVRIITGTQKCQSQENPLSWNIQGPQGLAGNGSDFPYSCSYCYLTPFAEKFKGKDFTYAMIFNSNFANADLSNTIFKGAHIENTDFKNAILTGVDFSDSDFPIWGGVGITANIFDDANLTNVNFSNSRVNSGFNGANLQNANFTNANLKYSYGMGTAVRTGIIWSNTTCPDGTNSDNNGNTCEGHF